MVTLAEVAKAAWCPRAGAIDHHAVHVREPHGGEAQSLHADAIIDVRPDAFDVQLMYCPQHVTLEMGGTLSVPGSRLRRINETDTGRYRNLLGQDRLVCPARTGVFVHHGLWRGGRRNDSDVTRYMFKIRFNPTVRQRLLWDTSDLDDPRVTVELRAWFPWYEQATGRLEPYTGSCCGGRSPGTTASTSTTGRPGSPTAPRRQHETTAALRDGRRLFQAAQLLPPYPGHEYDVSFLKCEFFFERLHEVPETGA